jgi:hypothetical protein
MRDYLELGATPAGEPCAQVGSDDYHEKAICECRRYRDQLILQFGNPPDGANFAIKRFPHDFGSYHGVVIYFDNNIPEAINYAFNVESNLPEYWCKNILITKNGKVFLNEYMQEV